VDIKRNFSESDVCVKQITRAIVKLGWDEDRQIRREVPFTDGRIIVTGNTHTRGKRKRADFILFYKPLIRGVLYRKALAFRLNYEAHNSFIFW
jgi:type I restriction enzyme R subunit